MTPDLEDVIDAAKTIFEEQFPSFLAAVEERKTLKLNTPPPAAQATYFGDTKNIPNMPALLFTGYDTQEQEDQNQWRRQKYELTIEAYLSGSNLQNLSRMMRRYGTAIDETLRNNQELGGKSQTITNIKQKYYDTVQRGAGLLQVCTVTCDVIVMTN